MTNILARYRALQKRRRERRLAHAYDRVNKLRERNPPAQPQLELDDEYVSKREHDLQFLRQLQLEQAARRAERIESAHAKCASPPHFHGGCSSSSARSPE